MAQLLLKLGIKAVGGNYATIKRTLQRLNLACKHWTGQAWSKGERTKDWENYSCSSSIKRHITREIGYSCSNCFLSEWMGEPIPLEIHHIDGDRTNNDRSNLEVICCNCHGLTENWKNKKRGEKADPKAWYYDRCPTCDRKKRKKSFSCVFCRRERDKSKIEDEIKNGRRNIKLICSNCGGEKKDSRSKVCTPCHRAKTKINWPTVEEMKILVWEIPTIEIGRKLEISEKALGKFCRKNNISKPPRGYWKKLKSESLSSGERT